MTLDQLILDQTALVKSLSTNEMTNKLADMGFYPGKPVRIVFTAPFGGPLAIDLDGYTLSLRKDEAAMVEVE